jgi:flagellar protein FliJ
VKRFQFGLEKVLRLRSQETEQAKRALARAIAGEAQAREAAEAALALLRERTAMAGAREQAGMAAYDFGAQRTYLAFLQKQVVQANEAVLAAEERTRQRRLALLDTRRRERALEKLKERRLEQYQLESLREEQKELDEYGIRQGLNSPGLKPDI